MTTESLQELALMEAIDMTIPRLLVPDILPQLRTMCAAHAHASA